MNKKGPACTVIGITIGVNGKATYGWMGGAVTGHSVHFPFSMSVLSNNQPEADGGKEAPGGDVVKRVRLIAHEPVA